MQIVATACALGSGIGMALGSGESRLHVGNPFQIRLLGDLKQKNIVAQFGDTV